MGIFKIQTAHLFSFKVKNKKLVDRKKKQRDGGERKKERKKERKREVGIFLIKKKQLFFL